MIFNMLKQNIQASQHHMILELYVNTKWIVQYCFLLVYINNKIKQILN